ncbi:MAG: hypothetical protein HC882_07830, partial [Acidobacteria bacterium]|nr:hypothetical protein [Acidobacteriota bacterium]
MGTRPGQRRDSSPARSILGALVAVVLGAAVYDASGIVPAVRAAESTEALLLYTGSVNGFLDQCGCARFPLGGFDRRASYVASLRRAKPRATPVLLDVGNFSDTPGAAGEVKTRAIVEAMNMLGYAVSGVGERDLAAGSEIFRDVTKHAKFPFVSTNLIRERSKKPWLPQRVMLRAGGLRIGVLAVTRYNPS